MSNSEYVGRHTKLDAEGNPIEIESDDGYNGKHSRRNEELPNAKNQDSVPELKIDDEEMVFQREFQSVADDLEKMVEKTMQKKDNEKLSEAKERVEEAYENKEDERTDFEKKYPVIASQLKIIAMQNPKIETDDLVIKVWETASVLPSGFRRASPFGSAEAYNLFAEYIDDIDKLGIKLNADCLLGHLSCDGVAINADRLARHGAELPQHRQDEYFSYGTRLECYDGLAKLGYKKSFRECFEETEGCLGCKSWHFKTEREQALIDNLDTILAHGIKIGEVVRLLGPDTIEKNYDVLEAHGARFVNPAKQIAARRGKRSGKKGAGEV
ncbi:hypothetical protein IKG20_00990 [Candidatus Saccharibacteria bacterium]|nr:hypothetical protein [Candidatus Saccharibacteria bacterium]